MGQKAAPKVAIGLPVYNGQRYLPQAIDAILAQTHSNFELIICDNCSDDATRDICEEIARRDARVKYRRNDSNIGANANFDLAFRLSDAPYFTWKSHDDLIKPRFLEACIGALEADKGAVLAFSRSETIDANGRLLPPQSAPRCAVSSAHASMCHLERERAAEDADPVARFRDILFHYRRGHHFYGVIRSDALRRTWLNADCLGSETPLLAELALHGRFVTVAEPLFQYRLHPASTIFMAPEKLSIYEFASAQKKSRPARLFTRPFGIARRVAQAGHVSLAARARCLAMIGAKTAEDIGGSLKRRALGWRDVLTQRRRRAFGEAVTYWLAVEAVIGVYAEIALHTA